MRYAALISLVVTLTVYACERGNPPSGQPATNTIARTKANTEAPFQIESKIAKIVFLDTENACDCTRKRIEETWKALQAALDTSVTLTVERIHVDTQAALAEPYTLLKPLMIPPGIYLVDEHDAVIEMLQGAVKKEQIVAALKR
jgi:hypothetical protein